MDGKIKVEIWNGHEIRFVEKAVGDWWAVAADVTDALDIQNTSEAINGNPKKKARGVGAENRGIAKLYTPGGKQEVLIINEKAIYRLVFRSHKAEAEAFQDWVCDVLRELRQESGLEGFQIFQMLDKEHQKEMMAQLQNGMATAKRIDYVKANTVANKAVSNAFGYPKMIKKSEMTPEMLVLRQSALTDTVNLMTVNDSLGLRIPVSATVYGKYS